MSTVNWSEQQTGRTTRMMLKAIERARAGEAPIIVINSISERGYLREAPALFVDHHVFEVGYDNASLDYLLNRYSKEDGAR